MEPKSSMAYSKPSVSKMQVRTRSLWINLWFIVTFHLDISAFPRAQKQWNAFGSYYLPLTIASSFRFIFFSILFLLFEVLLLIIRHTYIIMAWRGFHDNIYKTLRKYPINFKLLA